MIHVTKNFTHNSTSPGI